MAPSDQDENYNYDGLYQIVNFERGNLNINRTDIAAIPVQEEDFGYDSVGNWMAYGTKADGVDVLDQIRSHNRDNEITLIDGSNDGIAYDKAGNATQLPPDEAGDWEKFYKLKWDAWNRLVEVRDDQDSLVATYAYDGRFYRINKVEGATTTHCYYNDKWKCVEERENTSTDASIQYAWGERSGHRDELAFRDRDTTGNGTLDERLYCLMDYYNATSIIDINGDVQERYNYSAFGIRRIMAPNFSIREDSLFAWIFGFKGQFLDTEESFYCYGFRVYSPSIGRWLSRDPVQERGGNNLFCFVGNDPINDVDFLGLITKSCGNWYYEKTDLDLAGEGYTEKRPGAWMFVSSFSNDSTTVGDLAVLVYIREKRPIDVYYIQPRSTTKWYRRFCVYYLDNSTSELCSGWERKSVRVQDDIESFIKTNWEFRTRTQTKMLATGHPGPVVSEEIGP